jgi:hypothetical protein
MSFSRLIRLANGYCLALLLGFSACQERDKQERGSLEQKGPEQEATAFQPRSFSLTRLDSVQSFLDSLRTLPRADSLFIRQFLAAADPATGPDQALHTATTFHRYASLQVGGRPAEVIAEISEINTVRPSLHLMLFDEQKRCVATVPLALHYDEAGGREDWSSVQNKPTSFLQRREKADFVYKQTEQEVMDPIGRGTTVIHLGLEIKNQRVEKKQIDSTYTVTKY